MTSWVGYTKRKEKNGWQLVLLLLDHHQLVQFHLAVGTQLR